MEDWKGYMETCYELIAIAKALDALLHSILHPKSTASFYRLSILANWAQQMPQLNMTK